MKDASGRQLVEKWDVVCGCGWKGDAHSTSFKVSPRERWESFWWMDGCPRCGSTALRQYGKTGGAFIPEGVMVVVKGWSSL